MNITEFNVILPDDMPNKRHQFNVRSQEDGYALLVRTVNAPIRTCKVEMKPYGGIGKPITVTVRYWLRKSSQGITAYVSELRGYVWGYNPARIRAVVSAIKSHSGATDIWDFNPALKEVNNK